MKENLKTVMIQKLSMEVSKPTNEAMIIGIADWISKNTNQVMNCKCPEVINELCQVILNLTGSTQTTFDRVAQNAICAYDKYQKVIEVEKEKAALMEQAAAIQAQLAAIQEKISALETREIVCGGSAVEFKASAVINLEETKKQTKNDVKPHQLQLEDEINDNDSSVIDEDVAELTFEIFKTYPIEDALNISTLNRDELRQAYKLLIQNGKHNKKEIENAFKEVLK